MRPFDKPSMVILESFRIPGVVDSYTFQPRFPRHRNQHTQTNNHTYKTLFFSQSVDHFGYSNQDKFQERYLLADQYWNKNGGPIFFYTGNEGDITMFVDNTGFIWDTAPEFNALIIFAEHRYYGESLPYGASAFKNPSKLNYLTSEQALADYASLILHLKATIPGAANSPVIAIGGSYGGMLAAWFRIKYPNVVDGAFAASAPIWQFGNLTKCDAYAETVTADFQRESSDCVENIRNSWKTIESIGSTDEGRAFISSTFRLCSPLTSPTDLDTFMAWLNEVWGNLAMVDYPMAADFLEPLPAWPIKSVCMPLSKPYTGKTLIQQLALGADVYFNYTGQAKCLNTSQTATSTLGDLLWSYQACTEMVMPFCTNGVTDMFPPSPWNFTAYSDMCYQQWKVRPSEDWVMTYYWGQNITDASNIIFSNGLLDPWHSGGVLKSLSGSLIAIQIPDGAHHLDLRSETLQDPPDVIAARETERNILRNWLNNN
ncbi:hypothetical protein ScPMuIL_011352 [Solemya velum]